MATRLSLEYTAPHASSMVKGQGISGKEGHSKVNKTKKEGKTTDLDDDGRVLPSFYSRQYFCLLPGEAADVTIDHSNPNTPKAPSGGTSSSSTIGMPGYLYNNIPTPSAEDVGVGGSGDGGDRQPPAAALMVRVTGWNVRESVVLCEGT